MASVKVWREPEIARNLDAERAVLGCVLINPALMHDIKRRLHASDFSLEQHRFIYEAMTEITDRGDEPDILTTFDCLKAHGRLEAAGGAEFVSSLTNFVPHSEDASQWVHILLTQSKKRAEYALACTYAQASQSDDAISAGEVMRQRTRLEDIESRLHDEDGNARGNDTITPDDHAVATFPVEALPKPLRNLTEEGAQAICCPPDFIGVIALAVAGAAIGNSTCLEIKPGWRESPVIDVTVVAEPGSAKSPAYELAVRPFMEKQRELTRKFEEALAQYTEAQGDAATKGSEPEPVMAQVWTNDATLESLGDALVINPRGLFYMREELAGWVRGMNQYKGGKGADRQAWLSMWSCAPIMVNRRGRKHPQHIAHPFVTVAGTIQPEILSELVDERGREDGFIHRILFAYPERVNRRWSEDTVSEGTRSAYHAMFDMLWALEPDENADGTRTPHVLRFTPTGKRAWVEWITDHYSEMDAPDFPVNLRGPWAKMQGYAARFALILHLCRRACGESQSPDVDEASMLASADLADYFKSHAKAVYRQLRATPEDQQLTDALAWIRRQPEQKTTARNLLSAGIGGVSTSEAAKRLLRLLEERGYGKTEEKRSKHGRPSFIFALALQSSAASDTPPAQKGSVA